MAATIALLFVVIAANSGSGRTGCRRPLPGSTEPSASRSRQGGSSASRAARTPRCDRKRYAPLDRNRAVASGRARATAGAPCRVRAQSRRRHRVGQASRWPRLLPPRHRRHRLQQPPSRRPRSRQCRRRRCSAGPARRRLRPSRTVPRSRSRPPRYPTGSNSGTARGRRRCRRRARISMGCARSGIRSAPTTRLVRRPASSRDRAREQQSRAAELRLIAGPLPDLETARRSAQRLPPPSATASRRRSRAAAFVGRARAAATARPAPKRSAPVRACALSLDCPAILAAA